MAAAAMAAAAILKKHKNRALTATDWPIFAKFGAIMLKNLNFQNPRWRTAAILKTVKLPYLHNRLTDLYEIWYASAKWVS